MSNLSLIKIEIKSTLNLVSKLVVIVAVVFLVVLSSFSCILVVLVVF